MIQLIRNILPRTRISHPVSKLLRPMFEARGLKTAMGVFLAMASVGISTLMYSPQPAQILAAGELGNVPLPIERIKAIPSLAEATGISQKFNATHPGIDITAPKGADILPVADGIVETIGDSGGGYGRHVIIRHSSGLNSLYAHMGRITIDEGQTVSRKTKIGEIGMTGLTTGPHLHLEIRKNGMIVNPLPYLR